MTVQNILTIDVEEWFHICGVSHIIPLTRWPHLESRVIRDTQKILEMLKKAGVRATFFVLGYVAEKFPDLIRRIDEEGHELASHGYNHRRVYRMTPQAFREDLLKTRDILFKITDRTIRGYRAPEWSIRNDSLWALDVLQEEGFIYDSSMAPLPFIGHQENPRTPHKLDLGQGSLWEFPPLVLRTRLVNLPLGGGWGLGTFPYSLIRQCIREFNRRGQPALIYFHPREFGREKTEIRLPLIKRFVLQARLESAETRLNRLLRDFHFTTIRSYLRKDLS